MLQLQAQRLHVVVAEDETLALVHAQTVDDAGVRLGIVDHHVARRQQAVDDGNHALVAEVEQESIFLAYESGQLAFQLLVVDRLTAHHAGAHRGGHAELGGTLGIGLAYFGQVGQTKVVVQAPVEHLLAPESHTGADFAFQLGESIVAVSIAHVLADRAAGVLFKAFENINHCSFYLRFTEFLADAHAKIRTKCIEHSKIAVFLLCNDTYLYLFCLFGTRRTREESSRRCLDAAHGESEGPAVGTQRSQLTGKEAQKSCVVAVRRRRRRRPRIAVGADHAEVTRHTVALARSRVLVAIAQWECRKERFF